MAIEGGGGTMFGEELKLTRISVGLGRDCLEVASDLDVVGVLELERELHQGVGDVGRRLVGDGELVLLLCAAFADHLVNRQSRLWYGSSCPR
jgi:hypothetical protein